MEEEQEPEEPHSVKNLHAHYATPTVTNYQNIIWFYGWLGTARLSGGSFDKDVDAILNASCKGEVDRRLQSMSTLIMSIGAARFDIKLPKAHNIVRPRSPS